MTAEEFETGYAARSGITIAELHDLGLYPEPCDCGEVGCEGWAMDWAGCHAAGEPAHHMGPDVE
jgi:hypothetical protein